MPCVSHTGIPKRLANGNTLICSGANGTVFEVTPQKEIVWKYVNPVKRVPAVGPPPRPGQLMSPIAGEMLGVSAGQRKLLELARALMLEPRLVLLDEPMAGVNATLQVRLFAHIADLRRTRGITFLFIEHNMDVVMTHADRVVVMAEGRVIADGPPGDIRRDRRVLDAYLGTVAGGGR